MEIFNYKHQENNNNNTKKPPRNNNKTKKSGDKYLFLSCCKTDDVIMSACVIIPGRHEDDPVVKCVEMEEKDDFVLPKSDSAEVSVREDQYGGGRHRKKDHKKIITRVLKAVLFDTTLAKKIKKRKLIQKLRKSNAKLAAKLERGLKPKKSGRTLSDGEEIVKKFDTKNVTTKISKVHPLKSSNPPSVCSDPQTLSARTFDYNPDDSKPKSDNVEEQGLMLRHGKGMHNCSSGLCLILLSLLVLVMWGKVCAIVCTSTWLFLVPRLGSWNKSFRLMDNSRKIDYEEQKKKIIMEGLLQRNRNRGP